MRFAALNVAAILRRQLFNSVSGQLPPKPVRDDNADQTVGAERIEKLKSALTADTSLNCPPDD